MRAAKRKSNVFSFSAEGRAAMRLEPDHGYRGILESVTLLGDGFVRAVFSGQPIDLPEELEPKLLSWLGKPTRVAFLIGEYFVFQWRRPERSPSRLSTSPL